MYLCISVVFNVQCISRYTLYILLTSYYSVYASYGASRAVYLFTSRAVYLFTSRDKGNIVTTGDAVRIVHYLRCLHKYQVSHTVAMVTSLGNISVSRK